MEDQFSLENRKPEKITKMDAAQRQIDTAVYMFFHDRDMLPTYALVAASIDVLKDLAEAHKVRISLQDFRQYIKPEYHTYLLNLINDPKRFFKHAKQDPSGVLDFYPNATGSLLLMACMAYAELTHNPTQAMELYVLWSITENPKLITSPPENDPLGRYLKQGHELQKGANKARFYDLALVQLAQRPLGILKVIAQNYTDRVAKEEK